MGAIFGILRMEHDKEVLWMGSQASLGPQKGAHFPDVPSIACYFGGPLDQFVSRHLRV